MKKILILFIIAIIFSGILSFTGCKRMEGEFDVEELFADTYRNLIADNSYFRCSCTVYSVNFMIGKIKNWSFKIYDSKDELLLDINDANQDSIGYDITVEKRAIQSYFSGNVNLRTTDPVTGDLFNGKEPARVIFRGTIEDQNGYTSDLAQVGPAYYTETK